jgi:hypothetical protein
MGEPTLPSTKRSLAEKLLAFAVAAVYAAAVAYIVVGVGRRAAVEVRALRAEKARRKPAAPKITVALPRAAAAVRRLLT